MPLILISLVVLLLVVPFILKRTGRAAQAVMQFTMNKILKYLYIWGIVCIFAFHSSPTRAALTDNISDGEILIRQCIETNLKIEIDEGRYDNIQNVIENRCIGTVTDKCFEKASENIRGIMFIDHTSARCSDSEGSIWYDIRKDFLSQILLDDSDSQFSRPEAKEALRKANEMWESTVSYDCDYTHIKWGRGTLRFSEGSKCWRNMQASRAILYREWLYDVKERVGG